jgi:hypothetical protein
MNHIVDVNKKVDMTDDNGKRVQVGDRIAFSYGIPPVPVVAPVVRLRGRLVALMPGHSPGRCELSRLRKYVGGWVKWSDPS